MSLATFADVIQIGLHLLELSHVTNGGVALVHHQVVEEDANRKQERRRDIEEDIKGKNARKKQKENAKMKQIDEELQRVRQEEDRLREEIMKIQGKSNGGRTKEGRHFC
ncbi:hypothetical protein D910_12288 [Dendroctonus ponderosae]|uniref:Uncharacterized protein n=1 Tax=Dendroctonus ponderosae TaxID=77166 RepID=U4UR84_DENPD|nr:hypothetical protein D910_12288 [Dendroctonus ponderosae]